MTPVEKINLRNGGALVTIANPRTRRARSILHDKGHHDLCARPDLCEQVSR